MRADLQRYYGLNLDRMGADFGAYHAASCLACLPQGSELLREIDERTSWSNSDFLLHSIASMLAGKELEFPWDKAAGIDGIETESLPVEEFADWYHGTEWKEVEGWRVL